MIVDLNNIPKLKNCIYKITSPSGRHYIGSTRDLLSRFKLYKRVDCKSQPKLYNSFIKYGIESHEFSIIEQCEFKRLYERERYWGFCYDCIKKGLNCLLPNPNQEVPLISEETRKKFSRASTGRKHSKETIEKMSKSRIGIKFSEEHKENLRRARIGRTLTADHKDNIKKAGMNRKVSPEVRKKLSKVKGRQVIHTETGKIFNSAAELSRFLRIAAVTVGKLLNGKIKDPNWKYAWNESPKSRRPTKRKYVLDTDKNILYRSVEDLRKDKGYPKNYIYDRLSGRIKNDSSYQYIDRDKVPVFNKNYKLALLGIPEED